MTKIEKMRFDCDRCEETFYITKKELSMKFKEKFRPTVRCDHCGLGYAILIRSSIKSLS
jgi:predicted Zn finger-like uncharacterized protein